MRIPIDSAVDYLLAILAHRSSNEAHRQLGKVALEELREYPALGADETEKAYNKAVIAAVLSAARAFSVERDRISGIWRSVDEIKARHLSLLAATRALSPLAEKNYWARAIAVLSAAGLSLGFGQSAGTGVAVGSPSNIVDVLTKASPSFVIWLLVGLVLLELLSHVLQWAVGSAIEKRGPVEKQSKWQKLAMGRYEEFVRKYILEHIALHRVFFPEQSDTFGRSFEDEKNAKSYIEELLQKHLYYKE